MRRNTNLALFFGQFALSLQQTMFMFYYVKVFLNVFHINEYWFNVSQILFMIWNAVNDPLFGYIQDIGGTWMKDRSKIFTYFGPLMSISFLSLWFRWSSSETSPPYIEGLHLIFALFVYDATYSCVGVSWAAFFTETTCEHSRRVNALKYSQLAILLSVNIIMITEKFSHSLDNFGRFQTICIGVSIITIICFIITGRLGSGRVKEPLLIEDKEKSVTENFGGWRGVVRLTFELLRAPDFQRIVFLNFVHTMRGTAHLNFASIATDLLIPQSVLAKGSWQISAFFAACTLMPQIFFIANEKLLVQSGAYRIMMYAFFASILSAGLYILSWSPLVIVFFMLIDSIAVHSVSPLFNILLAEFVEDDTTRNNRKSPLSSLIFSLNAFVMKPAQSIAPIVIVYFLNRNGYTLYQKDKIRSEELSRCMLKIIFSIPLVLAAIQIWIFRNYSLRNKHRLPALPI
ncbi:hypothetical protein M3Y97_00344000 [Aphelenchoides bicaudatus]|nr:hypothetical protein M3Y97_00344000 [Aphelenchoides bicaudatus]